MLISYYLIIPLFTTYEYIFITISFLITFKVIKKKKKCISDDHIVKLSSMSSLKKNV